MTYNAALEMMKMLSLQALRFFIAMLVVTCETSEKHLDHTTLRRMYVYAIGPSYRL